MSEPERRRRQNGEREKMKEKDEREIGERKRIYWINGVNPSPFNQNSL